MSSKRWIKGLGCALAVVGAIVLAGGLLLWRLQAIGGLRWDYPARDHDPLLNEVAATARPLIAELDRYRAEHGRFPPEIKTLGGPDNPWTYMPLPFGYSLSKSLGWDPTLVYLFKDGRGQWVFNPGDGSPTKEIVL